VGVPINVGGIQGAAEGPTFSDEGSLKNRPNTRREGDRDDYATLGKQEPQPPHAGGWAGFAVWTVSEHSSVMRACVGFV
jgi:hypothetical protein